MFVCFCTLAGVDLMLRFGGISLLLPVCGIFRSCAVLKQKRARVSFKILILIFRVFIKTYQ
uniref:Uncharacterized protein n=1 Tax=Anguilla anguilla TaxID=7936 RepID=A0A0E9XK32_ANGAN